MRRMLEGNAAFKLPSGLHKERVQWLYDGSATVSGAQKERASASAAKQHLLYWMQTSVRSKYNYSLEYAVAAANALALPLRVVYFLGDRSVAPARSRDPNAFGFATERHAKFGLEGLCAVHKRLAKRGLSFHVFHHSHAHAQSSDGSDDDDAALPTRGDLLTLCARDAALVVTDRPYLRPWRAALDECAREAERAAQPWGLVQVEGDVVVPCEVASDKEEYAARTIRPKITRQLGKYLVELEHADVSAAARSASTGDAWLAALLAASPAASPTATDRAGDAGGAAVLRPLDVAGGDVQALLASLDVDRRVRGVSAFEGGETAAVELAKRFLESKLAKYADERNEPSGDGGSNLSLYLRFGHISPVRVALAANKVAGSGVKAGRESFLEELIVRRELAVNMAAFNADAYDSFACLPSYAAITLQEHAQDARAHLYSLAALEAGKSFDVYWNAAQLEMVATGKMHGYMRMYWGKKILEWTRSPEEGFAAALLLNNKYALDAPDPNSYTGIAWTFGKHDQGWAERPIFGKVRYMNESGLKRKFRMDAYVRKVHALVREYRAAGGEIGGDGDADVELVVPAAGAAAGAKKRKAPVRKRAAGDESEESEDSEEEEPAKAAKKKVATSKKPMTKASASKKPATKAASTTAAKKTTSARRAK